MIGKCNLLYSCRRSITSCLESNFVINIFSRISDSLGHDTRRGGSACASSVFHDGWISGVSAPLSESDAVSDGQPFAVEHSDASCISGREPGESSSVSVVAARRG